MHRLALLPCFLAASPVFGQTLSRGPSVWSNTATSFVVAFRSSTAAVGEVEWGPTPALGMLRSGPAVEDHALVIDQLLPEHFYWYRVRLAGAAVSPVHRVRTFAADRSDLDFFVFGDCGSVSSGQRRVASLTAQWTWDLGLLPGDIVYPDGSAPYFDIAFFDPYAALLPGTPFFTALGNHDVETESGQPYLDAFHLPQAGSGTERWYAFDSGSVHFVTLDSTSIRVAAQTAWLRDDLQAARAAGARWIFVQLHHPAYSSGHHGRTPSVYDTWCPIFEEFEVDAVFQGHDHHYERSRVMHDFYADHRGVVYFVNGTGGASLYGFTPQPYSAIAIASHGLLRVALHGNVLRTEFISADPASLGQVLDSYEIVKGPVTPALRATSPNAGPGQTFTCSLDGPQGWFHALLMALAPDYVPLPGHGILHLPANDMRLVTSGFFDQSERRPLALSIPNNSALRGTEIFLQGAMFGPGGPQGSQLTNLLATIVP